MCDNEQLGYLAQCIHQRYTLGLVTHTHTAHPHSTLTQHTLTAHPHSTPSQHTHTAHLHNTHSQHTHTAHPHSTSSQHTLTAHPCSTPSQHTLTAHCKYAVQPLAGPLCPPGHAPVGCLRTTTGLTSSTMHFSSTYSPCWTHRALGEPHRWDAVGVQWLLDAPPVCLSLVCYLLVTFP